jgi:ferredoxin
MRAIVDEATCIGCALCVQICPEVFKMEGDKAVSYVIPVPEAVKDSCKEAAEQCPVNAITVKE